MKKNAADAPEKTASKKKGQKAKNQKKKPEKIPHTHRPDHLHLDAWQFALRKQFGEVSAFDITNTGSHPFFSDFIVHNPGSKNDYHVAIRHGETRHGRIPRPSLTNGGNFCSCQDFKTNRFGLCKHISAVMAQLTKRRGAKKAFREGYRQPHSAIYLDYRSGREIRLCIGTERELEFQIWAKKYFDAEGRMLPAAYHDFVEIIREARDIQPDFRCYPDAFDFILQQRDQLWREAQMADVAPRGASDPYFDNLLKANLFPYQKTGIHFAARAGRCLLADEMGLGKTVQAIGAAELFRREFNIQKVLVICPTSLKYQWRSEIRKFSEGTSTEIIEGWPASRKKKYARSEAFFQIVSYHTVVFDIEHITKVDYDLIILDEAQRIKNFRTKVAAELKKIHTPYCIVLTGTPLENKLEELYSVVQFIDQYKLPPLYRFLDRYQIQSESGKVTGFKNLKEIGQLLADSMIRRTKKEVLSQLPKRMDKILYVPMTPQQNEIHRDLADQVAKLVMRWQKQRYLSETDRKRLILSLSQMRMVCDSTFILDQRTRFDTKIAELMCILEEALATPEQKVVVFSQWERMTRLVAQECDERGIGFANLHGGVDGRDRGALIERFREDPDCRIFLSTDAGGVGLNLQIASLLINLDIPWNPAVLEQRIARIYRLGQENNVTVINMVSSQTIEHRMLGILDFKADMAKGVLDPEGEDVIFMTESRFKKFMENVEALTGGTPEGEDAQADSETWQDEEAHEAAASEITSTGISGAQADWEEDMEVPEKQPLTSGKTPAPAAEPEPVSEDDSPAAEAAQASEPATRERDQSDAHAPGTAVSTAAPATPQDLVRTGVSFLAGLADTLSSAEKTQALVASLVEKDEASGQTYLKIPVENPAVVENAMRVLGSLFASFGAR